MTGQPKPFSIHNNLEIQRLELALQSAGIGTWQLNPENDTLRWCHRTKKLFGFSGHDIITFHEMLEMVHPDDRKPFQQAFHQVQTEPAQKSFSVEFRCLNKKDGRTIWVLCKGQVHHDEETNSPKLLGSFVNVTGDVENRMQQRDLMQQLRIFQIMVEQAPMAIGFLSGPEMIITVGNAKIFEMWGKDASITGMKLLDALPEINDQVFISLLRDVYTTGKPYNGNGVHARLLRNGVMEDVYFDFVYTPLRDHSETITGVMVLATDVTEQIKSRKNLEASEAKFRALIEQAPVGTCLFVGKDMIVELANEPMIGYWGKDKSVIGKPLREAIPELEGQPFLDILDSIYKTGIAYSSKNAAVDLEVNGVLSTYYYNFTYKPIFNSSGEIFGIINMSIDVTQQVKAQKSLEESESKLRSVIESAPAAMGLFIGRDLVVEMPNQAFIEIVGKGPDIAGKPLSKVMPELENQPFLQILDDVYTTGTMYQSFGTQVHIERNGILNENYYDIIYSPIFDNEGKVYAILDIATDVTERVVIQKQIEESQMQLLALFEQSPVAIAIISRDELRYVMANPYYNELVGRGNGELVGKPLLEAIPEIAGQGFDLLLRNVIETGIPFISKEQPVQIFKDDRLQTIYVDLNYQPQRDMNGRITGVLVVAMDITQQVLARQKIEEAESSLRSAVELADLGTWQIELASGRIDFSGRLLQWFGIDRNENLTREKINSLIPAADLLQIQNAMHEALKPGTPDKFNVEFMVQDQQAISKRILHTQGKIFFNEKREATKIIGAVQDITIQKKIKLALELQVQQRTEELEALNEELASINEEYLATNEELSESNQLLIQSNQNLQQFAYVASHDLQEPLRKIQSFGNLLGDRYAAELGEGRNYLLRMQSAAKRMSDLIEDLLAFSRISTKKENNEYVPLNKLMSSILTDLELSIQESGAELVVGDLPVITGDAMQLGQLFQNLISNALKFRKKDIIPVIRIQSQVVSEKEIPLSGSSLRSASYYYKIDVKDNGIGFDQKYADRIFQLFQRLHGRSEYSGTGIGLAICEKVAANHGGMISVISQPDNGSVFSVFLPA
ncbi:PAS domain S-box protein [Dyadobacter sediminis]|uniref:histidine kinase n=1 Tax=Dyadobacter sediminis TaxID=1493691 RepID=A0A5R9KBY3_9BACT|nr:PAS domain S-box protein [Dyadobacter sediminis]TLU92340.1 PAS domain S-box protein [Dyadobacter sediminis]GGB95274.1 hypothetical protein GCM10011325_23310 [Dyadobacter sediminis]